MLTYNIFFAASSLYHGYSFDVQCGCILYIVLSIISAPAKSKFFRIQIITQKKTIETVPISHINGKLNRKTMLLLRIVRCRWYRMLVCLVEKNVTKNVLPYKNVKYIQFICVFVRLTAKGAFVQLYFLITCTRRK